MIGRSLSMAVAVAEAAMARQEGQTDKKGHTVPPSVRRCGRLKIELFLPLSPSILSKGAEQTVKRGFRFVVRGGERGREQVTLSLWFPVSPRTELNGIVVKNKKKSKQRFWRERVNE